MVEHLLAKERVVSSNLISRSITDSFERRRGQEVKAGLCKSPIRRFESARRLQFIRSALAGEGLASPPLFSFRRAGVAERQTRRT